MTVKSSNFAKGVMMTCVSAALFGITPVLASETYEMGSNALTLTFYRNLMAVPVLLVIMAVRKIPFRLTLKQLLLICAIGAGLRASTTFMLYASYDYIGRYAVFVKSGFSLKSDNALMQHNVKLQLK